MNLISKTLIVAAAVVSSSLAAFAAEGLDIHRTAPNNTIIHVTGGQRYVLRPIEEEIPDARIDVLVDGRIAQTF